MNHLRIMRHRFHNSSLPRAISALLLAAILAVALVFGVVLVAVLLGVTLIFLAIIYIRAWRQRRRLGLNLKPRHRYAHRQGTIIKGEYTVQSPDRPDGREHR